jgi:LuxR family transcriptional regulator, maltose regulon positive regulatory protein
MKSPTALRSTATAPHYTSHNGEVSTHECPTPPRPLKTGANRHDFPNREAMVHKALERFLRVENLISRPVLKEFSSIYAYLEFRGRKLFMKIITSKIMIPTEVPRVCRQRLLDTMRENLKSGQATLINGRAGAGKTMLAVDFIRRQEGSVAWYKVDAPDMSLPVFLEYLVASVARVHPGFGRQTLDCHARAFRNGETEARSEFDIAALAEAYVYDLERHAEPLVLVIDDLHLIYDADWIAQFFHRLIPLLPVETHMLILGRGLPPAPMWRLLSKQRLFVINEQMLAFTPTEAEELFSGYGLSADEARLALKQTGGRAAVLHSVAIRAL